MDMTTRLYAGNPARHNAIQYTPPQRGALRVTAGRMLKKALAWRYRDFRPGSLPARRRRVDGMSLLVSRGVYDPTMHFTSAFFARYLGRPGVVERGSRVLDVGTGTGVLAIAAASAGASLVVATDIDPAAVRCANDNVRSHSLQGMVIVLEGDLFAPLEGRRFDLIVCNPPYFRGVPGTPADRAFYAGKEYEWLDRFAEGAAHYLEPDGRVLVVLGDAADLPSVLRHLARPGWRLRQVARKDIWVEVLYVFEMTPVSKSRW